MTQEPLIHSLTLQTMPSYDFCKELEHLKKQICFFYEKMLSLCSQQTSHITPFSNNRRHVSVCNMGKQEDLIPRVSVDIEAEVGGVEVAVDVVIGRSWQRLRTVFVFKRRLLVSPEGVNSTISFKSWN